MYGEDGIVHHSTYSPDRLDQYSTSGRPNHYSSDRLDQYANDQYNPPSTSRVSYYGCSGNIMLTNNFIRTFAIIITFYYKRFLAQFYEVKYDNSVLLMKLV